MAIIINRTVLRLRVRPELVSGCRLLCEGDTLQGLSPSDVWYDFPASLATAPNTMKLGTGPFLGPVRIATVVPGKLPIVDQLPGTLYVAEAARGSSRMVPFQSPLVPRSDRTPVVCVFQPINVGSPPRIPQDMSLSKFGTTGRRATGLRLHRISVGLYQLLALDLLRWGLRHLLRRVDARELYGVQSMRNGLRQAGCVSRVDLPVRLYCQVRQSLLPPMTLPTFSG
jgi:hypothetical protein